MSWIVIWAVYLYFWFFCMKVVTHTHLSLFILYQILMLHAKFCDCNVSKINKKKTHFWLFIEMMGRLMVMNIITYIQFTFIFLFFALPSGVVKILKLNYPSEKKNVFCLQNVLNSIWLIAESKQQGVVTFFYISMIFMIFF